MNSCIYEGRIRHRRFTPVSNHFAYSVYMMYLDLDELPAVFRSRRLWSVGSWNAACFMRRDYLGDPEVPLKQAVLERVERACGFRPTGAVRLLTQHRTWGYCFNPVSFYYCYDADGARVQAVVAEITNTPWNERHAYVLRPPRNGSPSRKAFEFSKVFHVSPFMDMDVQYRWRIGDPGLTLAVHMDNLQNGRKFFDASMMLRRREINGANLSRVLLRYPLITVKVSAAIYYQAFRLWRKRAPFYEHPAKRRVAAREARS